MYGRKPALRFVKRPKTLRSSKRSLVFPPLCFRVLKVFFLNDRFASILNPKQQKGNGHQERQRGIDEPVQEKRVRGQKWYKHRVRRYFEERNKTKAPGELLPWLNAMFAPIHQPYDDVVGRKRI